MPDEKYPNNNLYYRERSEKRTLPVSHIIRPYWKLNFVKNKKGKKTQAAYELSEKFFGYALREFIKDCKIISKKKETRQFIRNFYENRKLDFHYMIEPDFVVLPKEKGFFKDRYNKDVEALIFEFDGDKHYYSSTVINSDNNKMKQLENFNLRRIRIPYYFQLTKDIAKFIFDDLIFHYTGQKYYNDAAHIRSVEQIYRHPKTGEALKDLEKENPFIYSPGLHTSEYVPGSLHNLGLKKICDDFDFVSERDASIKFPESTKHQFFKSLQLYINDCNLGKGGKIGEELVLPLNDSKEAQRFMKEYIKYSKNLNKNYLDQVFFTRERYDL